MPHRFKKKGNDDQYKFNLKVTDAIVEAKEACSSQQLDKVHASLEKGAKLLSERQKHILLADKSDFGWSLRFWRWEKDNSSRSQNPYPSQTELGSKQDKVSEQQTGAFRFHASRSNHFQPFLQQQCKTHTNSPDKAANQNEVPVLPVISQDIGGLSVLSVPPSSSLVND